MIELNLIILENPQFLNFLIQIMDNKSIIKIACVGDSITQGCNVPIELRPTESYPAQLQKMLGLDFKVHNYGYGGRTMIIETSPNRIDESWKLSPVPVDDDPGCILLRNNCIPESPDKTFYSSLMLWQPDIIVTMLGTNDSKERHWNKARYTADYKNLVDEFLKLPSKPSIYICSVPFCYSENKCDTISANVIKSEVNPTIPEIYNHFKVMNSNIFFIDVHQATKNMEENFDADGVHPFKNGMTAIASAIYNAVRLT